MDSDLVVQVHSEEKTSVVSSGTDLQRVTGHTQYVEGTRPGILAGISGLDLVALPFGRMHSDLRYIRINEFIGPCPSQSCYIGSPSILFLKHRELVYKSIIASLQLRP